MSIGPGRRRLLCAAGGIGLGRLLASCAAGAPAEPAVRVIDVVARKFEFVPGEIHVRRGEPVELHLTAPEVPMGFHLLRLQAARRMSLPGRVAVLRLRPDKVGTFIFACDVFCGSGHEDMSGSLIVSEGAGAPDRG